MKSSFRDVRSSVMVFAEALTPIHVGAGRAPGVVDLPVIRDSMGYPFIPASGIKGALKNLCVLKVSRSNGLNLSTLVNDDGRLKCNEGTEICCCLFGPEPGEGDKGSGMISILDMVVLAMPAPSADKGYVYVTTKPLLMRAEMIAEALGMHNIANEVGNLINGGSGERVDIAGVSVNALRIDGKAEELKNHIKSLGGLAATALDRLYLVSDAEGVHIINKSLQRITRVRLMMSRKVVRRGGLWTEEYVPAGAIFIGGVIKLPFTNEYCGSLKNPDRSLKEILEDHVFLKTQDVNGGVITYVGLGGKETIGRGLMKVKII